MQGLPNGPQRATALDVTDPNIGGVNANDVAVALNTMLGIRGLAKAFNDIEEAKWMLEWLSPPSVATVDVPPAGTHPQRDAHAAYDSSHGNRVILEAAFPQLKKLDDVLLAPTYSKIHRRPSTAVLCLSGGGIRSATFALGVVQALAGHNLLTEFDYLSTVSGGGYLGGWLSAWIHRRGIAEVNQRLSHPKDAKREPEHDPIHYLREFSNYLAPRVGVFSGDTWTLAAIYLRNLFLNWLVLIPLFSLILLLPQIALQIMRLRVNWPPLRADRALPAPIDEWWLAAASLALGIAAIGYSSLAAPGSSDSRTLRQWLIQEGSQSRFLFCGLLPRISAAVMFSVFWYWHALSGHVTAPTWLPSFGQRILSVPRLYKFIAYSAILGTAGSSFLIVALRRRWLLKFILLLCLTISGALGGLFLYWMSLLAPVRADFGIADRLYVCLSGPLFLLAMVGGDAIFQGLASRWMDDADREWVARSAAWIFIAAVIWLFLALMALFGPAGLLWLKMVAIPAGVISGLLSLIGGWSSKTPASASDNKETQAPGLSSWALDYALPIIGFLFIVILGATVALADEKLLTIVGSRLIPLDWRTGWYPALGDTEHMIWPLAAPAILVAILALILLTAGWSVDINKFSMHAMYRERLIRAYLGASRERGERKPNLFTGFDPRDDLAMEELRNQKPIPLLNITLNLVSGTSKRLAWQERKAESFTISPFHSGNLWSGYRGTDQYGGDDAGIHLGTAIAISGAAASPNCGYASSAVLTFLLALFNARLGWWLGNPGPAGGNKFSRSAPLFAPGPLIGEALGATTDDRPYVYLSDGGHFENLGLYEAVLRRCHYVVAVDASADPNFEFTDLAGALRKIRINLGIPIEFNSSGKDLSRLRKYKTAVIETSTSVNILQNQKRATIESEIKYCAVACIRYSEIDSNAADGYLIYIKPTMRGTEPPDVIKYESAHTSFPHESTVE